MPAERRVQADRAGLDLEQPVAGRIGPVRDGCISDSKRHSRGDKTLARNARHAKTATLPRTGSGEEESRKKKMWLGLQDNDGGQMPSAMPPTKATMMQRLETSLHFPEPHKSFNVEGVREEIEEIDGSNFVAMSGSGKLCRLARCLHQDGEVASESRRVAG